MNIISDMLHKFMYLEGFKKPKGFRNAELLKYIIQRGINL